MIRTVELCPRIQGQCRAVVILGFLVTLVVCALAVFSVCHNVMPEYIRSKDYMAGATCVVTGVENMCSSRKCDSAFEVSNSVQPVQCDPSSSQCLAVDLLYSFHAVDNTSSTHKARLYNAAELDDYEASFRICSLLYLVTNTEPEQIIINMLYIYIYI